MKKINDFIKKIDQNWHLEILGILVISIIMYPIIYLCIRDGNGSAIFQMHDQLDETILNYIFPAKYFGQNVYAQMMCGVPSSALKPFCIIFVPLYKIFNVYTAFVIQYFIVIVTAFVGMYLCIKKITTSSFAALISASIFSFLPVHSVYGNVVMGTPLLIYFIILFNDSKKRSKIISLIGIIYYGLSTSFVLSGWAALSLLFLCFIILSIKEKKCNKITLYPFLCLLFTYIICNIDMIFEVLGINSYTSHRVEFSLNIAGTPFISSIIGILTKGDFAFEAESKHTYVFIPFIFATLLLLIVKKSREYFKAYIITVSSIIFIAVLYAFFSSGVFVSFKKILPGMLKSFQFIRFYYFLPGLFFILLGISCAIIIKHLNDNYRIFNLLLASILCIPAFLYIVKDHNGIFYQNINQINNGQAVTGYQTMQNVYSEDLMSDIENAIGKDMESYRIVSIGISPVGPLLHGFYTIDGYSNNYPLEYKKTFRNIIKEELELNDYNKAYFDQWGNRCYAFYHEWGNAYMLGNGFTGTINDLRLDFQEMKKLNCQYIFSAGEILDYQKYNLSFIGNFTNESSYWNIWVYEVN